jgi:hypothetical protein
MDGFDYDAVAKIINLLQDHAIAFMFAIGKGTREAYPFISQGRQPASFTRHSTLATSYGTQLMFSQRPVPGSQPLSFPPIRR